MTAAEEVDLDVIQGATYRMQVTWADQQAAPISLAGYRALLQVRTKAGASGVPLISLSSEDESPSLLLEPSGQIGVVDVRIGADKTRLMRKPTYAYDLFLISQADSTEAVRLTYGLVNVSKSVTVDG